MPLSWAANTTVTCCGHADFDLRATAGSSLTVQFKTGTGSTAEGINASGDLVQTGYPYLDSTSN